MTSEKSKVTTLDFRDADEKQLHDDHMKLHLSLDKVDSPNLSAIKELSKKIHFAAITSVQQMADNKGDAYYQLNIKDFGKYYNNLTLSYTVVPGSTGVVYGIFKDNTDKEGNKSTSYKSDMWNNYARFIVDLVTQKVVYARELEEFIIVKNNSYTILDDVTFGQQYPIDAKRRISDFIEVMKEIYKEVLKDEKHFYKIYPQTFAGKDWTYDISNFTFKQHQLKNNELYFLKYDVDYAEIDLNTPNAFLELVAEDESSLHNIRLVHAYTMLRKVNAIPAEKWFLLKDFGRSGKGLFMETFNSVLNVTNVNMDSLVSGGFEAANEWMNFYGADVAHANETGEINTKNMRVLRKVATAENIQGRHIGRDVYTFKNRAVLILDTNEDVDTGEITANRTRTVKISFKDRPKEETDAERHDVFSPYWKFVKDGEENSVSAGLSFMMASLEYLKSIGGKFVFKDVTLKAFYSADDFTQTQELLLMMISKQGYVLSSDEHLQAAIKEDYISFRYQKAKDDIKRIGVDLNKSKWIEGQNNKVHQIGNEKLFNEAVKLLKESLNG